jgi:hypothetical protein
VRPFVPDIPEYLDGVVFFVAVTLLALKPIDWIVAASSNPLGPMWDPILAPFVCGASRLSTALGLAIGVFTHLIVLAHVDLLRLLTLPVCTLPTQQWHESALAFVTLHATAIEDAVYTFFRFVWICYLVLGVGAGVVGAVRILIAVVKQASVLYIDDSPPATPTLSEKCVLLLHALTRFAYMQALYRQEYSRLYRALVRGIRAATGWNDDLYSTTSLAKAVRRKCG